MTDLLASAKALLAASMPAGALLFVTSITLEWWSEKHFWETTGWDPRLTIFYPPPPTGADAVVVRIFEFVWLCFFITVWAAQLNC